jgi:hypothetical protein
MDGQLLHTKLIHLDTLMVKGVFDTGGGLCAVGDGYHDRWHGLCRASYYVK